MTTDDIAAFVINLSSSTERLARIRRTLEGSDIPWERYPAVNGRRKRELIRRRIKQTFYSEKIGRTLGPAEIGVYLSHVGVLKRIVRRKLPYAIILEDDVVLDPSYRGAMKGELREYLRRSDIVKLEGLLYSETSKLFVTLQNGGSHSLIVPLRPSLGAAAYAVTLQGAVGLLKAFDQVQVPFDHALIAYEKHRVRFAELRPFPMVQAEEDNSLIREDRLPPPRISRLVSLMRTAGKGVRGLRRAACATVWRATAQRPGRVSTRSASVAR